MTTLEENYDPKKYHLKLSNTVKKRKTDSSISQEYNEQNMKDSNITNFIRKRTTSINSAPQLSSDEEEAESELPKKKKHNHQKKHESNDIIANNFVLFKEIANGTFGKIIYGFNIRDSVEVAVKKEIQNDLNSQIKIENKVYCSLLNIPKNYDITGIQPIPQHDIIGVPKFYGTGKHKNNNYIILEFLGPNLSQLFKFCDNKKYTIVTTFLIGIQMINRIENLHKFHFIHRDIKPENFVIGTGRKSNIIYLIDFGLSKKYKNPKNHQHIPYRDNRKLTGTVRYISINTHMGVEQSRRDDLESVAYVLILFLKGRLPWQNTSNDKKFIKVMKKKMEIPTEILCYELPEEMSIYLNYCKSLRFEDRPDYDFLKSLFIKGISKYANYFGLEKENLFFDWLIEDKKYIRKILKKEKQYINEDSKDETFLEKKYNFDKTNNNLNNEIPKLNQVLYKKNNYSSSNSISSAIHSSESSNSENDEIKKKIKNNYINIENSSKISNSKNSNLDSKINNSNIDSKINLNADSKFNSIINLNFNSSIKEEENKNNDEDLSSDRTLKVQFNGTIKEKTFTKEENEKFKSFVSSLKTKEKIDNYIDTLITNPNSNKNLSNLQLKTLNKDNESDDESYSSENLKEITTPTYNMKLTIDDNNGNNYSNRKLNYQLAESGITFHMKNSNSIPNVGESSTIKKESKFQEKIKEAKSPQFTIIPYINNSNIHERNQQNANNNYLNVDNINTSKSFGKTLFSSNEPISNKQNESFEKDEYSYYTKKYKTEKVNNSNIYKHLSHFPHQIKSKDSFEEAINKGKSSDKLQTLKMLTETGGNLTNIQLTLAKENLIRINYEPVSNYYIILDNVGQGSYGKVKKVKHRKLNEIRAMKIVDKKSSSSHHEIEILRKISHPNILNIFEIFEDTRHYYIICEYCEGGELFSIISKKGFFNEKEAAKIIKQILQGVNYLHTNNIIHRDLKPENIIFVSNDTEIIKIIDFGTAIEVKEKGHKLKKIIGTPYYMAPEVLKKNYNEKCDIWSCGVILFLLLCGYPPFNGRSNKEIYNKIENSSPIFYDEEWNDISKEAKDLCKKMLKKNPNERLSASECLKQDWFNIINSKYNEERITESQNKIIEKMALFVHQNKFKQAVLQFISTQFDLKKEEEDLRMVFKEFDQSNQGVISKEDFNRQLEKIYGSIITNELADEVFAQLDLDNSGSISYNEFITSVIGNRKNITEERLEKAFKMLDKNNNGLLSIDEIKNYFGGDDETWKEVLKDVDENGDGEVDFKEFKKIMLGLKQSQFVEENNNDNNESDDEEKSI